MMYLNTQKGFDNFKMNVDDNIFVDKSMILSILNTNVNKRERFFCVTRPRRFGKSQMTFLLESYYSKAVDSKEIFDTLNISKADSYLTHLNKYNVIKIDFSNLDTTNPAYKRYIGRIKEFLTADLETYYPDIDVSSYNEIADKLEYIYTKTNEKFIFIFDEWDFIFNKHLYTTTEYTHFLEFLRNLLKDKTYVLLCYMTGILPIKIHSTGSSLNMFWEYTLLNDGIFEEYFGFTEEEVRTLCIQHNMDYTEVEQWYNGYITMKGLRIFNPRSVNIAISNKMCRSYWVNTGAMDEVLYYLKIDPDGLRDDIIRMLNGESIEITIKDVFRAGQEPPKTKEKIYSAMITLGFLTYSQRQLSIPNKELMMEFEEALKDKVFGAVAEVLQNSNSVLKATLNKDSKAVAKMIHDIHQLEIPLINYKDENSMSCVLTLAYLSARDIYRIEREERSGKGYVDFSFHPLNKTDPPIIVELKYNRSTKAALKQIVEQEYFLKYQKQYKRDIVIVGINYSERTKKHTCAIALVEYNPQY